MSAGDERQGGGPAVGGPRALACATNDVTLTRRVRAAAGWGFVFQAVYAGWQFATLAVLYPYLGAERFGLWGAAFALTNWSLLAQLGVNRALLSTLAHASPARRARLLRAALGVVGAAGLGVALLCVTAGWFVPWSAVFNVTGAVATREAAAVAVVTLAVAFASAPLTLGGSALQARQRGDWRYAINAGAFVVTLLVAWVGVRRGWSLVALGGVLVGTPALAGVVQWWVGWRSGTLVKPWRVRTTPALQRAARRRLLRMGLLFVVIELQTVALLQLGPVVAAQAVGAEGIAPYLAVYRLAGLVIALCMVSGLAFWPAFAEAFAGGRTEWAAAALRKSLALNLAVCAFASLGLMVLGRWLVGVWLGEGAVPTLGLLAAGCGFAAAQGLWLWTTAILSAGHRLRPQVVGSVAGVAAFAALSVVAVWMGSMVWVFAAQAGATVVALACNAWGLRALRRAKGF